MNVFQFSDYKALTLSWVKSQDKGGRGQFRKMALELGVGTTLISQIFSGDRHLNMDQALAIAKFMGFPKLQKDFYMHLVQHARASTPELKEYIEQQIESVKYQSQSLKKRLDQDHHLSEIQKATFYSDWHYSAIRNLIALPGFQQIEAICVRLNLEKKTVQKALDFLVESGLCRLDTDGYEVGPGYTHLEADSPFVKSRSVHWRMKGVEVMNRESSENLFYTCPMSLSDDSRVWVRSHLLNSIQEVVDRMKGSDSETLACLNIDWFKF